jgi:starch synthase (maltosyl-transferring)
MNVTTARDSQAGKSADKDRTGALRRGRERAVLESLRPEVDCGRFPVKRSEGDVVRVEVDAFTDGHDKIRCLLAWRRACARKWQEEPMAPLGNDRWQAGFRVEQLGRYQYTAIAWVDAFLSWRHDLARWETAADVEKALAVGAVLARQAAGRASGRDADALEKLADTLEGSGELSARRAAGLGEELGKLMQRHPDRSDESRYERVLEVLVEPERARFSSWYELFPRSAPRAGAHGTFRDVEAHLDYVADMGFDVLYFPPIHPIGKVNRKGPNNTLKAGAGDAGSPWAIGSDEGGHKSIHPELGTDADFRALVKAADERGIAIALDIAFQCAPDHPYVKEHPEWFRHRPDGSIQYAENPPKKYQDIYPFDFESEDWRGLWRELRSVFEHWIERGVTIFRVDNPHTKAFPFWEWAIADIKRKHPDVILLSEAFTRPRVMHRLAKLGFSQSYTYFTWRNTKEELIEYGRELSQDPSREYFRPNFWPNTPDILHEYLQAGVRPAFVTRLVLAATMSANYGIYGPAFELLEHRPRETGSEEYLDSEKYQVRDWNLEREDSLKDLITRVNAIRHDNRALQANDSLKFLAIDNPQIVAYAKATPDLDNVIITVVNLDPHHRQSGFLTLPVHEWRLPDNQPYQVHDLLSGSRYLWHGWHNYVELDPRASTAHIFRLRRHIGTERDFDTFA